jgi:hypothetical protein
MRVGALRRSITKSVCGWRSGLSFESFYVLFDWWLIERFRSTLKTKLLQLGVSLRAGLSCCASSQTVMLFVSPRSGFNPSRGFDRDSWVRLLDRMRKTLTDEVMRPV